ncbi:MAG TPA: phenylalanine--tRNA ligase subunit beta [Lentimicrobium sp.]|nr:phenylalanine--tRNA ligase subunit beta [Lentimicrobium sp.]
MTISYNWLKEYLKCSLDAHTISLLLTDIGLEVEAVEEYESIKGGLKGFVTGEVLTCKRHPNADKLSLTTVNVGGEKILNIVCGAPNVAEGQKVIVALEGAMIYKGEESFKIVKSKIRGEVSEGMICAEDELGIGNSHEGILVLPENVEPGKPASEYFNIVSDTIFEIGITPNHADALSHLGVARDLAAAIKVRNMGEVSLDFPDLSGFRIDNHELPIDIVVEDNEGCLRYSGISIKGVKVGTSPAWLQEKLKSIGLRPINNIVDISNFVLFEYGQPLHTFDAEKIKGNKVVIRKASNGSKFTTLDHVERTLTANDLMICDSEDPMCIAGVFGGEKSGVTENTNSVFIESACFDPVTIRKTSKHHSLKTDASFRFERGTDPEITVEALKRAALLIKGIAGGSISSEVMDLYPSPVKKAELHLKFKDVDKLIGEHISPEVIKEIVQLLKVEIISENEKGLDLSIPPFKVDVKTTADMVEEILRIYGYNKIESGNSMRTSVSYTQKPDSESLYNRIADYLVSNNFNEIMTNSLSSSAYYAGDKWFNSKETAHLMNPLSKELDAMRQTLLFGGLESIAYNLKRKQSDLRFFEFGTVYSLNYNSNSVNVTEKYKERKTLALFVSGKQHSEHWNFASKDSDFYYINGQTLNVLDKLGADRANLSEANLPDYFSSGLAFNYNNKFLYSVGQLKTELVNQFDIHQPVFVSILEWDALLRIAQQYKVNYKEVSKFPEVRRDLALVLDKEITYNQIEKIAFKVNKHLLKKVNLFDVYEGDKIESGKKSYAVSFILQDESKTLTDKDIDGFMNKLSKTLELELGARIRK